ncbi:WD repeat-containing protein 8 [Trachymyrmex zeteki]|uniref:WD repeat-containing protein 8 n=1 Tax=Mycetomoellerius zeteki TaxID=64791 RepID=A0A151X1A9_9HYME|nr:WD repeat-containing protein 8 [Trachymyrmex zeteki]
MAANVNEDKVFRVNNSLCQFSKNGAYLAIAFQANLLIKDAKTLDTCQSFVFVDVIQYMEWSSNSEYILCANIKRAIVQIYSIHYPKWKCKLTEGSAGLQGVTWSPDSKHIFTIADFNIQLSIWNLEEQTVSYIQNVKSSSFDKLRFSPNGERLAVIVTEGQDTVEIYKTQNWKISRTSLSVPNINRLLQRNVRQVQDVEATCSFLENISRYEKYPGNHVPIYVIHLGQIYNHRNLENCHQLRQHVLSLSTFHP